jgi:hypothetical protein
MKHSPPDWHTINSNERMLWADFIEAAGLKPGECVETRPSIHIIVGGRLVSFEAFAKVHAQARLNMHSSLSIPNLDDDPDLQSPETLERMEIIFSILTEYCRYKAYARKRRLAGDVLAAMGAERTCDHLHLRLPKDLQW